MTPDLALLRPALELAVAVARRGERSTPVEPAPRQLRPFLRFTRLPPKALGAARAAVDDDAEFRARVAAAADPDDVGRAGWLFLRRPDGWAEELSAIAEEWEADRADEAERGAVVELARVRAELDDLRRRVDEQATAQAAELARARRAASDAADEADRLRGRLERLELERDLATDELARAVRELKDLEARLARRTEELRAVKEAGAAAVPGNVAPGAGVSGNGGSGNGGPAEPPVDRAALEALVDRLRTGAEALVAAADELGDVVGTSAPGGGAARATSPRRRPTRLRAGLVDGTREATAWLLSRDDTLVLVDGYNVTLGSWPTLPLPEQRAALERAADLVQQRYGARVVLVFDGDDDDAHDAARTSVGSEVRVRFTAHGVEADDELLAMVERAAADVLVVVSGDHRVRDGAARRGANVLGAAEFLAVAR